MNVKEKIGLLGVRPSSAGQANARQPHGNTPSPYEAAVSSASSTKVERQAAALQLWNKWASEALGPMSADPTPEELARKGRRVQRLEDECAVMAARAQHRLEMSSAIRSTPVLMGPGGGVAGTGGGTAAAGVLLRPGAFSREVQYAVRERRKAAAYAAARAEGEAEAETAAAGGGLEGDAASSARAAAYAPSFKSRTMLDALIASRAAAATAAGGDVSNGAVGSKATGGSGGGGGAAGSSRQRPRSAMPQRSSSVGTSGRTRPRSAVPAASAASFTRQPSLSPSIATGGGSFSASPGSPTRNLSMAQRAAALASSSGPAASTTGPSGGLTSVPENDYLTLRAEMDSVSERLAATQAALEVQADTEAQLREAVDLLRARLHSAGLREVDAQRRLAQHTRLEPLFDRLAEAFTFSSPEEVVARLEFLEDDKLGTFDQLLRTQEEVTRLQQRLAEAQKAGETVATRLTTEHLQGSARLQEQNEGLRQELESMENLVHKLTARQAQLVALQTAVLQLWGRLSGDPQFAEAFGGAGPASPSASGTTSGAGGAGAGGGGGRRSGSAGRSHPGGPVSMSGGLDGDGGAGGATSDPLAMLHMIEEFVAAKSNKLAIRHFTDIQRIANHVWQQHFRNRAELRGRVVPTFEQLSKVAGRMADRLHSVQDQTGRSQEAERQLMREVRRLQQQKRVLENTLAKRDEQFKSIMGVPRRSRPASATAELGGIMRREANASAAVTTASTSGGGGGGPASVAVSLSGGLGQRRPASRAVSAVSVSLSGALGPWASGGLGRSGDLRADVSYGSYSMASGIGTPLRRPPQRQPSQLGRTSSSQGRVRPSSAPAPNTSSSGAAAGGSGAVRTISSRMRQAKTVPAAAAQQQQQPQTQTGSTAGGTLAGILSPAVVGQAGQMVSDMPAGAHWRQYVNGSQVAAAAAQRTAPMRLPAGSLFYAASGSGVSAGGGGGSGVEEAAVQPGGTAAAAVVAASEAPGPPSVRWSAPQRSAIEQAFLSRLERRTRVT